MLSETAQWYFFSTIAQTLGALMAFLGLFVVFRLEALRSESKMLLLK